MFVIIKPPPPPASLTRVLVGFGRFQAQSETDFEKEHLREQLLGLKEENKKMEGLVTLVEEEKVRLQEKVDKVMGAGEHLLLQLILSLLLNRSRGFSLVSKRESWCWSWSRCGLNTACAEGNARRLGWTRLLGV